MKIEPMPHTSISYVCISANIVVSANEIVQKPTVMLRKAYKCYINCYNIHYKFSNKLSRMLIHSSFSVGCVNNPLLP
jgi:hypothetical protein